MSVELIVALIVVILVAAIIYFNRDTKSLDVNQDGKVDVADAKAAVENTVEGVKKEVAKATTRKAPAKPAGKKPAVKAKTGGRTRKS